MDPQQFCRIRNGCFVDEPTLLPNNGDQQQQEGGIPSTNGFFRGMIASTRISEMLGVEPVEARDTIRRVLPTAPELTPLMTTAATKRQDLSSTLLSQKDQQSQQQQNRPWWNEVGDYLENPHRHFQVMDELRSPMIWPSDSTIKSR
jgi:hypothetical protein